MTLRTAAIASLLVSLGVGRPAISVFLAAFQLARLFLRATRILGAGPTSAALLRWAAVLDLFGYYLAPLVLAYVLWRILRPRNPVVADLATLAAIGYALIGGAGAAVLVKVGPMLMADYAAAASASEEAIIAAQFAVLFEVWCGARSGCAWTGSSSVPGGSASVSSSAPTMRARHQRRPPSAGPRVDRALTGGRLPRVTSGDCAIGPAPVPAAEAGRDAG